MKRLSSVFFALILALITTAAYANREISKIHSHCVCGENDCMSGHGETANWQAWNGDTSVGTASGDTGTTKYLYLENDVTVTSTLNISNVTVYLCLNGNTLTIDNAGNPAVRVGKNQTFVLCDCKTGGKITGAKGSAQKDTARFGAVNCQSDSNFVMYGGSISDNTVEHANGGGVFVNGGTFTMYGGSINNNKAPNGSGGAISVANGTINTHGGEMNGNSAINGGAIHLNGNIEGGICNIKADSNAATSMGGAIYTETSGIIKFRDIELSKNSANLGGGINLKFAANNICAYIDNANIHDNSASGSGGGIYLNSGGNSNPVTNMNCSNICKNTSGSDGGGIFAGPGTMLNLRDGSVNNNTCAAGGGGGIRAASDTQVMISKGENPFYIKGNTADLGGGISPSGDSFVVNGSCIIEENTARKAGGGVYIDYISAWCIFNSATITKNSSPQGGGICLNKKNNFGNELEISGGTTIIGNTSPKDGSPSNLYLMNGKKFQFRKGMTGTEKVGVSVSKTPTFTEPVDIEYVFNETWHDPVGDRSNFIIPDNDDYKVIYKNKEHWLVLKPSLTLTADDISVLNLYKPASLFAACYHGDRLLDIKSIPLDIAEKTSFDIAAIGLNIKGATKIKAFLLDSNIIPQCYSASAELSEN